MFELLSESVVELGVVTALLVFFVWRDWKRENRDTTRETSLTDRIIKLETEQREILIPMLENTTSVISRNTTVMERLEGILAFYDDCRDRNDCSLPDPNRRRKL